jgi:hypothetical protein
VGKQVEEKVVEDDDDSDEDDNMEFSTAIGINNNKLTIIKNDNNKPTGTATKPTNNKMLEWNVINLLAIGTFISTIRQSNYLIKTVS